MDLKSKLGLENLGILIASIFYLATGIVFLYELMFEPGLFHLGLLGVLSLISAYGILKTRKWTLWFIIALFVIGTTFALITLYYSLISYNSLFPNMEVSLLNACLIIYTILTWIFSIYIMAKRKTLEY